MTASVLPTVTIEPDGSYLTLVFEKAGEKATARLDHMQARKLCAAILNFTDGPLPGEIHVGPVG